MGILSMNRGIFRRTIHNIKLIWLKQFYLAFEYPYSDLNNPGSLNKLNRYI